MGSIQLWEAPERAFDRREIFRYAGLPEAEGDSVRQPLEECLLEARGSARCRGVWRRFEISEAGGVLDLGFAKTESVSLRRFLAGTRSIVLFAVTAGTEMDRLIHRAALRSPLKGLLMHAVGAERVEGACDDFCADPCWKLPGERYRGRFSPGYGDLPLSLQREVFAALDCGRRLGIDLNPETLLMTPSKSVTAIAAAETETE